MKRAICAFVLAIGALALSFAPSTVAEDKKETKKEGKQEGKAEKVPLEGTITCPKCDLGTADKCGTVIKVKDKLYTFDAASNKKYHGEICKAAKEGKVTGTVTKDGDKMIIAVSELEFKK